MSKIYDIWVGKKFKNYRLQRDMTLEQVGERIGKTKKQVQNYENGVSRIHVDLFMRLCDIYGIDVNDFMHDSLAYLAKLQEDI